MACLFVRSTVLLACQQQTMATKGLVVAAFVVVIVIPKQELERGAITGTVTSRTSRADSSLDNVGLGQIRGPRIPSRRHRHR